MERADDTGGDPAAEKTRHGFALIFALALHVGLFSIFSFVPERPLAVPQAPIPVKLVILDIAPALEADRPEETPVPAPEPQTPLTDPIPVPTEPPPERTQTEPLPETAPKIRPAPTPAAPPRSIPLSILSTDDPQIGEPIPDKWRLPDGARIPLENMQQSQNPNLEALSKSLDCLGFALNGTVCVKAIFAEDQLSGTDLVWMRSYAHSGLSDSALYGLSEAQIRERLGIPTAGKNSFMLLPGIGIDGPWWDALHGVNKGCDYGLGFNAAGQKQLIKTCKPLKPTSKDRIGFIPKLVE